MARIAIYIARHLCTAPRPIKEAEALARAGHDVTVFGVWFDSRHAERDEALVADRAWRFHPVVDGRPNSAAHRRRWFRFRLQHRLAKSLYTRTGIMLPDSLGYAVGRIAAHALRHPADLSIFHSEGGLWVADRLRRRGRRVGMDFEDWFSRDLIPEVRRGRPIVEIAALEQALLRHAAYTVTTSHALATALAEVGGAPKPAVIYNSFPLADATVAATGRDRVDSSRVSLHWFSLVLGAGRGLETLAAALHEVPAGIELHLRGDGPADYQTQLRSLLPERHRAHVYFHPTVPNTELPARIAQHDIGLALEPRTPPNKNLTVSNKMFQYLNAGLAVVASDTAGQREVLAQAPAAGAIFPADNPQSLGNVLRHYVEEPAILAKTRRAARLAADERFSHEHQEHRYAELVAAALVAPAASAP